MEENLYVMHLVRGKTYNKVTMSLIEEHVENLRKLDDDGDLKFCGVFKGFPGVAGMFILKAQDREKAIELCEREPLVVKGFATYKLYDLQEANRENNYLL